MKRIILGSLSETHKRITEGFDKHNFRNEQQRYEQDVTTVIDNVIKYHEITQELIDDIKSLSPRDMKSAISKHIPRDSREVCYMYAAYVYVILEMCGYQPYIVIGCAYDTSDQGFRRTQGVPNHVWIELNGEIYENFEDVKHINHRQGIEKFQY